MTPSKAPKSSKDAIVPEGSPHARAQGADRLSRRTENQGAFRVARPAFTKPAAHTDLVFFRLGVQAKDFSLVACGFSAPNRALIPELLAQQLPKKKEHCREQACVASPNGGPPEEKGPASVGGAPAGQ